MPIQDPATAAATRFIRSLAENLIPALKGDFRR